jgi:hypothetical protein
MPKHKKDKRAKSVSKTVGPKQTTNPVVAGVQPSATGDSKTFQQHDAAHRSGSFAGTGNHPRTGNPGHQ